MPYRKAGGIRPAALRLFLLFQASDRKSGIIK